MQKKNILPGDLFQIVFGKLEYKVDLVKREVKAEYNNTLCSLEVVLSVWDDVLTHEMWEGEREVFLSEDQETKIGKKMEELFEEESLKERFSFVIPIQKKRKK